MNLNIEQLKQSYSRAAPWVRQLTNLAPPAHRFSLDYYTWRRDLQRASRDDAWADERQTLKLRRTLMTALDHVPYYTEVAQRKGLRDLVRTAPFDALREFPIISREQLSAEPSRFESAANKDSAYYATTGGTSGQPVRIRLTNRSWGAEWAFVFNYLARFGVADTDRRLSLRGVRYENSLAAVEQNPTYRELRLSPFHMAPSHRDEFIRHIRRFQPTYIHGYPSAISSFLQVLGDAVHDTLQRVRIILCVSENAPTALRNTLEKAAGVPVISFYGLTERVAFIELDPFTGEWQSNSMYGCSEIIDGRLVATGYINQAMPLVRYDTGDHVTVGESGHIQEIDGRWKHVHLIAKSGAAISMTALNIHSPEFAKLGEHQIVQRRPGEAELNYLETADSRVAHAASHVAEAYTQKCMGEVRFAARPVRAFLLTPMGKRPLVMNLALSS
jgi:phenylacetate-CoA ligase